MSSTRRWALSLSTTGRRTSRRGPSGGGGGEAQGKAACVRRVCGRAGFAGSGGSQQLNYAFVGTLLTTLHTSSSRPHPKQIQHHRNLHRPYGPHAHEQSSLGQGGPWRLVCWGGCALSEQHTPDIPLSTRRVWPSVLSLSLSARDPSPPSLP